MMYSSCARGDIYRNGAWFDDAHLLNELFQGEASALAPEIIKEVFPPFKYHRGVPALFGEFQEKLDNIRRVAQDVDNHYRCGAASVLAVVHEAYVSNSVIYSSNTGRISVLYETHRLNERALLPLRNQGDFEHVDQRHILSHDKCYLWLGCVGASNYGHWLVDDLPRLKALAAIRSARPNSKIVIVLPDVGATHNRVHTDSIALLGTGDDDLELMVVGLGEIVGFDELFYVTPVTYHPVSKSPEAMRYLAEIGSTIDLPPELEDAKLLPRRLFVQRSSRGQRDLLNQDEVQGALSRFGLTGIDTESMSFAKQVSLFSNAELVIGCMGASMTNTVFCAENTPVGYLVPNGWVETFYWDLAVVRHHRYAACYGTTTDNGPKPWKCNYRIDLLALGQMVQFLIGAN